MAILMGSPVFKEMHERAIKSGLLPPDRAIVDWSLKHAKNDASTVTVTYFIEEKQMAEFLNPTKETA